MRVALLLSMAVVAIVLAATGAHAQTTVQGNDTGGIIPWSCENEAAARELAGAHCAGYRKFARISSVDRQYGGYIGFNCLWAPSIARYAIPAVPVRSACLAARPPTLRVRY